MGMLSLSCHCGDVRFDVPDNPGHITQCNCSLCVALGWRCVYFDRSDVTRLTDAAREQRYIRTNIDKPCLAVHRCARCGIATHWENLLEAETRMGFNANLIAGLDQTAIPVRLCDGASW